MSFDFSGSGRKIDYLSPEPTQFDVSDIARGMANTARFSGQALHYYSVAQHCLLVSRLVPAEHEQEAMLFGAAKAYCGDLAIGLKAMLPDYTLLVRNVDAAIRAQFMLPLDPSDCVEAANRMILAAAKRDLMHPDGTGWPSGLPHYRHKIIAVNSDRAYGMWSARWLELCGRLEKVAA